MKQSQVEVAGNTNKYGRNIEGSTQINNNGKVKFL